jgi:hypothetical protein
MARVPVNGPVGHHILFSPCPDVCQYLIDSKMKKRLDEIYFKADSRNDIFLDNAWPADYPTATREG